MEHVFSISILAFVAYLTVAILRLPDKTLLLQIIESRHLVLILATFLFALLLAAHFQTNQGWTAEVLKVLAGVLVGAAGATKQGAMPSSLVNSIRDGNNNIQSMGDVIQQMHGDIHAVRNAVITHSKALEDALGSARSTSIRHLFRVSLETDDAEFLESLRDHSSSQDPFESRIGPCLAHSSISLQLRREVDRLAPRGWSVESMTFDPTGSGLVAMLSAVRKY